MCHRLMFLLAVGCDDTKTITSNDVLSENVVPDPSGGGFHVPLGPDGLDGSTYYSSCLEYWSCPGFVDTHAQ
jgi:hypothetical protein